MATATAEAQAKTEQIPVTFFSRCPDQVLTRKAERPTDDGFGGKTLLTREVYIERQEDLNRQRMTRGEDPLPIDDMPWKVEFENSIFKTSDPRLIDWLRNRPTFKTNGPSSFDEEPPPAEDPAIAMSDPMKRIARASVEADVDTLVAVRDEENARENPRPAIAEAAVAALETLAEEASESEVDADNPDIGDPTSTSQHSQAD